jgi:TonB family protein
MISFGEITDGSGNEQLQSEAVVEPIPPVPVKEKPDELITQKDKSVVIPETKTKPEVIKPTEQVTPPKTDPRPQPKQEPSREEQLKKEQQASQKADELMSAFGGGGNTGSGNTQTSNTAGNPVGQGTSGGNSWSLTGRNLSGTMVSPRYSENEEGFLIVEIRVNAAGNVVSARILRGTISSTTLQDAAKEAAMKTKFSAGSGDVLGTITYNFKLR